MRPLRAAAGGLVLVAVDFRTVAFDLLPDVVGWALVAYAVAALLGPRVAAIPVAAGLCSLVELVLPYHVLQYDPIRGELVRADRDLGYSEVIEFDRLTGGRLVLAIGMSVLAAATVLLLTETLHRRARARGAGSSARQLRFAGWLVAAVWVLPILVAQVAGLVDGDGMEPVWDDPAARLALLGTIAVLVLVALFLREAREPWALRPGTERTLRSGRPERAPTTS